MDDTLESWSLEIDVDAPQCFCKGGVGDVVASQEVEFHPTVTDDDGYYREYFIAECGGCGEMLKRELHAHSFEHPAPKSDVVWEVIDG